MPRCSPEILASPMHTRAAFWPCTMSPLQLFASLLHLGLPAEWRVSILNSGLVPARHLLAVCDRTFVCKQWLLGCGTNMVGVAASNVQGQPHA